MKFFKKFILLIIALSIASLVYVWLAVNKPTSEPGMEANFVVSAGEGVNQISQNLYDQQYISNKFIFELYVWFKGVESKFIAGSYQVPTSSSMREIINLLIIGASPAEMSLRFIEGWTTDDIREYLLQEKIIATRDEFDEWNKAGKWQKQFSYLASLPADTTLEGFLFPDTYNFFVDASVQDVIKKMLENFDRKLDDDLRSEVATKGSSIYKTIILASVIEREVQSADDMVKIADIFHKRLAIGMMLQADSTLNYAIGGTSTSLTFEQLKIDSPYNSYKYAGLPPTPISNPGLNAIKAAIYPEANEYYFFLTDKEGKVYYGKTLEDHNYNRRFLE